MRLRTRSRYLLNNLPAERDTFIGRADALDTLATQLDGGARLVTILGIGGIGKTRLAIRYARNWLGDYPGGSWFCDLSTARDIDGIVSSVAHALQVPLGKSDPVLQIASAIAARGPCIIVLDTFEQVARHAEATVGVWLEHASEARFIVTSREVLGISGEQTHVLAPMADDEGASLFLGRASAVTNRLTLRAADQAAIAPLVKLLDGLPLAIELAAARARAPVAAHVAGAHERALHTSRHAGRPSRPPDDAAGCARLVVGLAVALQEKSAHNSSRCSKAASRSKRSRRSYRSTPDRRRQRHSICCSLWGRQVCRAPDRRLPLRPAASRSRSMRRSTFGPKAASTSAAPPPRSAPRSGTAASLVGSTKERSPHRASLSSTTSPLPAVARWRAPTVSRPPARSAASRPSSSCARTVEMGLDLAVAALSIPRLAPAMLAEVLLIKGRALRTLGQIEASRGCFEACRSTARGGCGSPIGGKGLERSRRPRARTELAWRRLDSSLRQASRSHARPESRARVRAAAERTGQPHLLRRQQ